MIVIGAGGIGTYARADREGARRAVAVIDIDPAKLERLAPFGLDWRFNAREMDGGAIKKRLPWPTCGTALEDLRDERHAAGPGAGVEPARAGRDAGRHRLHDGQAADPAVEPDGARRERRSAAGAAVRRCTARRSRWCVRPGDAPRRSSSGVRWMKARRCSRSWPIRMTASPARDSRSLADGGPVMLKDHRLVADCTVRAHPLRAPPGAAISTAARRPICTTSGSGSTTLSQMNSYTTAALRELILAFREASTDRAAVCVVLTGVGDRAFCSGGNTKEYAEYYAGNPGEYKQYMRLFNDTVTGILTCDKPVINRVNGLRVGGGQELGMACDFSIASDLARFGQAGPRHGSAPDGGSTDFLHLYVGFAHAIESCTLCEPWSAHKALRLGLLNQVVPVLVRDGRFIPNPLVVTDRWVDENGMIAYGEPVPAERTAGAKAALASSTIDLEPPRPVGRDLVGEAAPHLSRLSEQDHRKHAQEEARALAAKLRDEPQLARAEHDDRSEGRVPGLQRRAGRTSRGRFRRTAAAARARRSLGRPPHGCDPAACACVHG